MIDPENLTPRHAGSTDSDHSDDGFEFQDMELFCHSINEPQLAEPLKKHKVTLYQLLNMDENDLINCGIELVGDRKKILDSIAQAHCEKWQPSSLHDMTAKEFLTAPGIYIVINDINRHLEYIGVTLAYTRKNLLLKPDLLELGKDYVGIGKIISEIDDLLKTSKKTQSHISHLRDSLKKEENNPLLKPANHIDKSYIRRAKLGMILSTNWYTSYEFLSFLFCSMIAYGTLKFKRII